MSDDEFQDPEDLPLFDEEEEEELIQEEEEIPTPAEEVEEEAIEEEPQEPLTAVSNLPLTISIEMGRLTMSADQLLQLQPGQMVDLKHPAANVVNLVVNGSRIGTGELIQVGDVLGVRILDMG